MHVDNGYRGRTKTERRSDQILSVDSLYGVYARRAPHLELRRRRVPNLHGCGAVVWPPQLVKVLRTRHQRPAVTRDMWHRTTTANVYELRERCSSGGARRYHSPGRLHLGPLKHRHIAVHLGPDAPCEHLCESRHGHLSPQQLRDLVERQFPALGRGGRDLRAHKRRKARRLIKRHL